MAGKLPVKLNARLKKLDQILAQYQSALVAFSGGADSSFLLARAKAVLGEKVKAGMIYSLLITEREKERAEKFARKLGVELIILNSNPLREKKLVQNPPNRCYYCKKEEFKALKNLAKKLGLKEVLEASNLDDLKDYRPGRKALRELGIKSPLVEAGFSKEEIRTASKFLGLESWSLPSNACLASRFPYGEKLTKKKLQQVAEAEEYLYQLGFRIFRVRYHQEIARVELGERELKKLLSQPELREKIAEKFSKLGFTYTCLDLLGYQSGSLNKMLKRKIEL